MVLSRQLISWISSWCFQGALSGEEWWRDMEQEAEDRVKASVAQLVLLSSSGSASGTN